MFIKIVMQEPLVLSDLVSKKADRLLSFSRFTFTHGILRAVHLDQLKQAWTHL